MLQQPLSILQQAKRSGEGPSRWQAGWDRRRRRQPRRQPPRQQTVNALGNEASSELR
jgi:hypothetical protein